MMRHGRGGSDAGFTLIEVLAALVVFGFLVAGLTAGVRFGITSWRVGTRTIARDADLDQTARLVANLLERTRGGPVTGAPMVIGTAGELAFTTRLPVRIGDPPTSFADAAIGVEHESGEPGRLVLRLVPHYHAIRTGPAPRPDTTVLATGVESVQWGYFNRLNNRWLDHWRAADPPEQFRLSVTFADHKRRWPPIVASPVVSPATQ